MYTKLIFRNVRRSFRDYLIYLVTMTICVTLFYAFLSISSSFYHPSLGTEYDISMLGDGMKMAILAITLLLLFLIRYVNGYMLRRRQKEFAIQAVMGMEQRTLGWLFFAETFLMGMAAIAAGILLGSLCSQFLTAMLLSSCGQPYRLSWMLFPDTTALTLAFFGLSFLLVGLFNLRSIRKIKVIDMLHAERYNEKSLRRSRFMPIIVSLYLITAAVMAWVGIVNKHFYFDRRMAIPVHIMFWGNILMPALTLFIFLIWLVMRKKWAFQHFLIAMLISATVNTCFAAAIPQMQTRYLLSIGSGNMNRYLTFILTDLSFIVCCIIYLAGLLLEEWKEKSKTMKYEGYNLFFFGQIITKLNSSVKAMTLICLTLVLSLFLFVAAPALVGWSFGYLEARSQYDIQITSHYNDVYSQSELPTGDYELISDFLAQQQITPAYDLAFSLYLPQKEDFHSRIKQEFPAVAISLSDYNKVRQMCGYAPVTLKEGEFTTQWRAVAAQEEIDDFLALHTAISTDAGEFTLSEHAYFTEHLGTTLYNLYTDMVYVFPDSACGSLLSVIRNRYCMLRETESLSYKQTQMLRERFMEQYPEDGEGVHYFLRTRTEQVNDNKANNFVLMSSMIYSAVVLMVICLTILSLQQLMDAPYYKYRFGVLRKMGASKQDIGRLLLKQLLVWFGLPILTATGIAAVVIVYFFRMFSVQLAAYMGFDKLLIQVGGILFILFGLLGCYFVSTWSMFRRSV